MTPEPQPLSSLSGLSGFVLDLVVKHSGHNGHPVPGIVGEAAQIPAAQRAAAWDTQGCSLDA